MASCLCFKMCNVKIDEPYFISDRQAEDSSNIMATRPNNIELENNFRSNQYPVCNTTLTVCNNTKPKERKDHIVKFVNGETTV